MNGSLIKKVYGFFYSTYFGYAGYEGGITLDIPSGIYSVGIVSCVFSGSWINSGSDRSEVQRYHAFVFGIYYGIDVYDTGYLSNVYFATLDENCSVHESDYELSRYVS